MLAWIGREQGKDHYCYCSHQELSRQRSSAVIPENPIVISPTLAATIGLDEAVLLQVLALLIKHRGQTREGSELRWLLLDNAELSSELPFWDATQIEKVQSSLQSLGILKIQSGTDGKRYLAVDDTRHRGKQSTPQPVASSSRKQAQSSAGRIPADWTPDENWIRLCKQHAIPDEFIQSLVPEFVSYWQDRGQARFSWGNAFYKHVLKEWRQEQTRQGAFELASTMSPDWRPSQDALDILDRAGISPGFVEDAVAEFVLYWRERGVVHGAWNTKFIEHIRRQWAKFTASFGTDDTPRPIAANWQPSADCYEILQLAEIDEDYARSKIPEFVMYWRDSQQAKASWNTVFLQFIKQDWARRLKSLESGQSINAEDQTAGGTSQQRIKERFQRIADRSWAE